MPFLLCIGPYPHRPKLIKWSGKCGHEHGLWNQLTKFFKQSLEMTNRVHIKGVIGTRCSRIVYAPRV